MVLNLSLCGSKTEAFPLHQQTVEVKDITASEFTGQMEEIGLIFLSIS